MQQSASESSSARCLFVVCGFSAAPIRGDEPAVLAKEAEFRVAATECGQVVGVEGLFDAAGSLVHLGEDGVLVGW
jgi:hypothetical protein